MAKLSSKIFCIDCEEVFDYRNTCPCCGSREIFPLTRWIPSMEAMVPVVPIPKNPPVTLELAEAWR